jgi:hypothetical protein
MTTLKTLCTKIVASYLNFLPVTHMVTTDAWFNGYECSKTGHSAELSEQTGRKCEISGLRD